MGITDFFDSCLDAPWINRRDRWGAISRDDSKVYFCIWKHEIEHREDGRRYAKLLIGGEGKTGYNERRDKHIPHVRNGAEAWAIIRTSKPIKDGNAPVAKCYDPTPVRAQLIDLDGEAWLRLEP